MGEQKRRGFWPNQVTQCALALAVTLGLSGCGYDGWVRYPCQEFENWDLAECNRPECQVTGICTEDLIGKRIKREASPNE